MNDGAENRTRRKPIGERTDDVVGRIEVRNAILSGVQAANRRYERWSRGGWISDSGVEGHVVSTIGKKLDGLISGQGSIEMEMPFGAIQRWSAAERRRGRPRFTMNPRNRADIVILTKRWRPVFVIEVKRRWDKKECLKDLARIRDLTLKCGRQNDGTLKGGFLAFLLEGWEEEGVFSAEECLTGQEQELRRLLENNRVFNPERLNLEYRQSKTRRWPKKYRELHEQQNWVHAAVCVGLWGR